MTVKKIYYPEKGDTYGEYLNKRNTEGIIHCILGHLSIPKDQKLDYQISLLTEKIKSALNSAINLDLIPEIKKPITQQLKTLSDKENRLIYNEERASQMDNNRLFGQE